MPENPRALLIPSFAGGETEIFCSYTTKRRWNALVFSALRAVFPRFCPSLSAVFRMGNHIVEHYIIRIGSGSFGAFVSVAEYLCATRESIDAKMRGARGARCCDD